MGLTRRSFIAGTVAAAVGAVVRAEPQAQADFRAAASYSAERRGVSLLVMRDGDILFEDYPRSGAVDKAWELASGTKSFTGIMAAAAQADGLLDIDAPCARLLPEWQADARRSITTRHLLSLTSGLGEAGEIARPPTYANAVKAQPVYAPGERFQYGPTPFQVFGELLGRALDKAGQPADPVAWLQSRVLDPIGVRYGSWKRGRDDRPFMPQGARFTARDWARFGQWVLDGAAGVDRQVYATLFASSAANPGYGLSWWLLRPGLIGPDPRAGLDVDAIAEIALDEDIVMAAGAGDQRLYLFRDRGVVVVRQANQILRTMLQRRRGLHWNDAEFIRLVLMSGL